MTQIVCLMGPTASGKTQLSLELVEKFSFEIVSVDSAMVYRGMDIGTAKPTPDILKKYPHHLIDICDPSESYSAAKFKHDAVIAIEDILARQKIPLLVGGTMLYFQALQKGLSPMPGQDAQIRKQLNLDLESHGLGKLHDRLTTVDPVAAKRIHPHDTQRIQRALEVFMISGKNLTAWQAECGDILNYEFLNIAIMPEDREKLHQRIAQRLETMFAQGFIDEVKKLFARSDLTINLPAIRSVGYRQVWQYLQGELSEESMREKCLFATRQLAKRQMTWLRSWENKTLFNSEENHLLIKVINFLKTPNSNLK